jgi:hypothetical protein
MDEPGLRTKAVSKASRGLLGLFSRAPKAPEALDRLGRLLRRKLPSRVAVTSSAISLELHPAVKPVRLVASGDGELVITAPAAPLGPGYVQFVVQLLDPLLEEIDFAWEPNGDSFATRRDRAALEREFTGWLQHELGEVLAGRRSPQLGISPRPAYEIAGRAPSPPDDSVEAEHPGPRGDDVAVLTPSGPRSATWCQAVISDGNAGADFWPLWEVATEVKLAWARALWTMWTEVPWRLPIGDPEAQLMRQAHRELSRAKGLDPTLAYPWAEWAELVDYLDLDDDVTDEVRERGANGTPAVGYRRLAARFALTSGWSLRLTPNFSDSWQDEGTSMVATDGQRSIRCSCAEDDEPSAAAILAKIPMRGEVLARVGDGGEGNELGSDYQGRVEVKVDEVDQVQLLTCIMTSAGSAAVISAVVLAGDEAWALETWRSLRRDPGGA